MTNFSLQSEFELLISFLQSCADGPVIVVGSECDRSVLSGISREIILADLEVSSRDKKNAESIEPNKGIIKAQSFRIPLESDSCAAIFFLADSINEIRPALFSLAEAHRILLPKGRIFLNLSPLDKWTHCLNSLGFDIEKIVAGDSGATFDSKPWNRIGIVAVKNIQTTSLPDKGLDGARSMYDKIADQYGDIMKETSYSIPDFVKTNADRLKGQFPRVLDLACGTGMVGEVMASCETGAKVFGIDFSRNMIDVARNSTKYQGLACAPIDSSLLSLDQNYYDLCTAFGFFEFCNDAEGILNSIFKLLVPGGEFWATFELSDENSMESGKFDPSLNISKYHYSKIEVESLIKNSGFKIIDVSIDKAYNSFSYKRTIQNIFVRAQKLLV